MAMKRVKIVELKNHLSEHLRAVEAGAELEVTDRSRPIARIVPVPGTVPAVVIHPAKRAFADVRRKRHHPARWPTSSLDLLMEDRRKR
jgi:prevent-host-death family protein